MKYKIAFLLMAVIFASCSAYQNIPQMNSMNELNYNFDVKYVQLKNDIRLAYIDEGKGKGKETILFVHGLGSYIPAWRKNISVLKENYRCIAIDLPGYGKSSKNPHSGRMSFYAGVVAEFIKTMKLGKVILAGHSMGGQISMVTALHHPEVIDKLVLVDPAGFENFHAGQRKWFKEVMTPNLVRLTTLEGIEANLATNFYNMPDDAIFMITDRAAMRTASDFDNYCYAVCQSVAGMVDEPVIDKLSLIDKPTLIFFGENDNLIPNRYLNPGSTIKIAESGAAKIKNSKLIMVPKCGHFMMFEKSDVFNTELEAFLME